MADLNSHNKALYIGVIIGSGFLVFAALGPGLLNSSFQESIGSWQYQIFGMLCHQDPVRSFLISEIPVAVCSRCIGIYGFFFLGMLSLPVIARFKWILKKKEIKWLIVVILLNLADVLGNYFGVWTNNHITRIILGSAFGFTIALPLTNEFFTLKKSD